MIFQYIHVSHLVTNLFYYLTSEYFGLIYDISHPGFEPLVARVHSFPIPLEPAVQSVLNKLIIEIEKMLLIPT